MTIQERSTKHLDCMIIGAGPHGLTVASHLRQFGMSPNRLRILDPKPEPMSDWKRRTMMVGMSQLRSPAWLHIDVERNSLQMYAEATGKAYSNEVESPTLELFNSHSNWVISRYNLDKSFICGKAMGLSSTNSGWRVETNRGPISANSVVLALGSSEYGKWPAWAHSLKSQGASISHILEIEVDKSSSSIAIVGGGLSGVQAAISAAQKGQDVFLFINRPLKQAKYDTPSCWFKSKSMVNFSTKIPLEDRLKVVLRNRNPGTITKEVANQLSSLIGNGNGRISLITKPINRAIACGKTIKFEASSNSFFVDQVLLATGFDRKNTSSKWLTRDARRFGLPFTESGHPLADDWLQWAPGLYVCGMLGELQLGPTARGLEGGRRAGQLISHHILNKQ